MKKGIFFISVASQRVESSETLTVLRGLFVMLLTGREPIYVK